MCDIEKISQKMVIIAGKKLLKLILGAARLRLWGRYSLFKIIFGGVIIILANKSITTRNFTLLSVSVMISSLNDY